MKIAFDILIYLFSILGGIVSIYTLYKWMKPLKRISWKRLEKGIIHLRDLLINDNYYPSLIVGIGRGGSIVGALLSGTLGNIPIIVIDRVYIWTKHQRKESLFDDIKITKNIDKILLVAGELHTGNTARHYTDYFKGIGAKEVKMLTFMKECFPTYKPDYFYIETNRSDIRFPWMLTKNYKRDSKIDYKKK